jgi:hypothetical protein
VLAAVRFNALVDVTCCGYASPEKVVAKVIKAIYRNRELVLITHLARLLWLVKRLPPGCGILPAEHARRELKT